jgi:hypothetical protein
MRPIGTEEALLAGTRGREQGVTNLEEQAALLNQLVDPVGCLVAVLHKARPQVVRGLSHSHTAAPRFFGATRRGQTPSSLCF